MIIIIIETTRLDLNQDISDRSNDITCFVFHHTFTIREKENAFSSHSRL